MRVACCGLVLLFAGFSLACGFGGKGTEPSGAAGEKKVYTRDEFKKLVVGKTPDEVIAAVGKPDSTQENAGHINWYYKRVTKDPVTDKLDSSAQVSFEGGRVDRVNF